MHAQRLWRTGRLNKKCGKYHNINKHKDTRPGRRGYLEANMIDDIRSKAKQRGRKWTLTAEQAFKLITSDCLYCGFTPIWPESRVGIDRVDNVSDYSAENCVSCCKYCNSAKQERSLEEFIKWIEQAYSRLIQAKTMPERKAEYGEIAKKRVAHSVE